MKEHSMSCFFVKRRMSAQHLLFMEVKHARLMAFKRKVGSWIKTFLPLVSEDRAFSLLDKS